MKAGRTYTITRLGTKNVAEARKMIDLFSEVFETNPSVVPDAYLKQLLAQPSFIAMVAMDGEEIVGGVTAYELAGYYIESPEVFIYDIAVKASVQRQGIGKQLLEALSSYCKERGVQQVFVDASKEDDHAISFYRSLGGDGEEVVQFTFNIDQKPRN